MNFYIAAEIENNPVREESWKFTVGDDKKYEDYINKGLERGEKYIIYQRAVTRDNGVSRVTQLQCLEPFSIIRLTALLCKMTDSFYARLII